ncbi:MAG TPA: xylose isomerase [Chitinophagaceae bacterium]|jgi:sugar phosphate isomerase/epimerase|nr:xylose isomerase [Chitinophagaceae bacterium]
MHSSRRSFLKNSGLALAATTLLPRDLFSQSNAKMLTGVQLYSVRAAMSKDPLGTLKALAEMGYKYVEHANYVNRKFYGYTAKEFKKILNDLGMQMPSGHTVMGKAHWDATKKQFTDLWKYTVEDAAEMGQELVISPWLDADLRKTYDEMLAYMEVFNKSGELCKAAGMRFGYHNHDFEFTATLNGQKVYDIILKNTDPNLVVQQLDMGNLYHTGVNALEIVNNYPGRFVSVHVKDETKTADGKSFESTILGKGVANTKAITDLCKTKGGTLHFIIEQEAYQGIDPIECVKQDLAVMKQWGY